MPVAVQQRLFARVRDQDEPVGILIGVFAINPVLRPTLRWSEVDSNPRSLSKLRGREPGYGPRREFDCRVVGTQWSVCRRQQPL